MMPMSARRALWNWSLPAGLAASSAGTRKYLACRRQRPPQPRRNIHVFVVAGEPSGDVLGANLMCALKRLSAEKVGEHNHIYSHAHAHLFACIWKPDHPPLTD